MADTPQSPTNSAAPTAQSSQTTDTAQSTAAAPQAAQQAEATLANPNATPAQKAVAAKKLKSLKIKVDGQEYDESLPFEIDDTKENRDWMTRQLQMSKVANKRMGEKAQLENELRQFFDQLKKNPRKVLADPNIGIDLKKMAAEFIEEEIANSQKSPEQLKMEKIENELREEREARKNEQAAAQKREFERIQQMEYERYDTLMTQTLEKSDLPKSPYVVKKMADYMLMGLQEGLDITPEDVLPLVREEILADIQQMAGAMPLETIEKLFGGDILTKIRKKNVAKAKAQPVTPSKQKLDVGATPSQKTKEPVKKKSYKDFFGV